MDQAYIFGVDMLMYYNPFYDGRHSFKLTKKGNRWTVRRRDGTEFAVSVSKLPYYPNGVLDIQRNIPPIKFPRAKKETTNKTPVPKRKVMKKIPVKKVLSSRKSSVNKRRI